MHAAKGQGEISQAQCAWNRLISNGDLEQAKRAVEYYRRHIVRHNGLNKNSHS
jgi:hypothetical protein